VVNRQARTETSKASSCYTYITRFLIENQSTSHHEKSHTKQTMHDGIKMLLGALEIFGDLLSTDIEKQA
jgi:pyoverdine/dityrosine biosynthesis protein Dit1